jgi:hypothetical protein
MKRYQTPYYVIYSDLDINTVREAAVRLTAVAREYHERTRGFAGTIRNRLPFYLFGNPRDYHAAGGTPGSAGQYNGKSLMAVVKNTHTDRLWGVIQHEGFHQFAHRVIRGELPIWVNEGLAEYFGGGIWTGDGFVTGLIPPERLKRIQVHIKNDRILPFLNMLTMSHQKWTSSLAGRNYDQAWSVVHFLVHAEGGKYREASETFIKDISRGDPWEKAFLRRFGRNVEAFENRYKEWWSSLPEDPTADRYTLAVVQTLTSFLARAHSQGQRFANVQEFFAAAESGRLKTNAKQWLPPKLLNDTVQKAQKIRQWSLGGGALLPRLILTQENGQIFTGMFTVKRGVTHNVRVEVKKTRAGLVKTRPATSAPSGRSH